MTSPRDIGARDRIRDAHDASLFVEAGAGTGKTSALVDRVVALVACGAVELRHVAAITFTEAAAAELRDRVRTALETVANGRDELFDDDDARR
ncbi:MAG TPA: UvrD-helicase domain-containing protein, partial [Acidimicrobiia bacterium]